MAAGLGFIEFTTGDVLSAAAANGYLASQTVMVFATAAARTSAIASPQEGMFSFLKDSDTTQFYTGAAWSNVATASPLTTKGDVFGYSTTNARLAVGTNNQVLTADSAEATGLKWAAPATGGLELIQTTAFSAVSSQSINSVFSSTYDHYRVIFSATAAAALTLTLRLRVAAVDDSGTNYTLQDLFANGTAVSASRAATQTGWAAVVVRTTLLTPMAFDIFNPAKASPTIGLADTVDIGDPSIRHNLMIQNQNTAYDGFNMICSTSNMTGNVSIYGYKK